MWKVQVWGISNDFWNSWVGELVGEGPFNEDRGGEKEEGREFLKRREKKQR